MNNYATFAEAMKPPARERSGCKPIKASKSEPLRKRKRNKMKSVDNHIPRKRTAVLESESYKEDGESNAVEVRDGNNPLDM